MLHDCMGPSDLYPNTDASSDKRRRFSIRSANSIFIIFNLDGDDILAYFSYQIGKKAHSLQAYDESPNILGCESIVCVRY